MKRHGHTQGQRRIIGIGGVIAGLVLLIVFPRMQGISGTILLMGLFHLLGAVVVLRSGVVLIPPALLRVTARPAKRTEQGTDQVDFGWTGAMMNASWLFALAFGAAALGLQLTYPRLWAAWLVVALLAMNFLIGGIYIYTYKRTDWAVLPMADLMNSQMDHVLDVGCGSGRTTIALGRVLREGRITSLDRFDASYIKDGGRALMERNLELAGIADRVQVVQGDITVMPFAAETFDGAVSTHAMDHLGEGTEKGLREVWRTLKPGGRFLMVVTVPEWTNLGLTALYSLRSASKQEWRTMSRNAGFEVADEGMFHWAWYVLLKRPKAAKQASA